MKKVLSILTLASAVLLAGQAGASWYWPFGDSGGDETGTSAKKDEPRLSDLMEPASLAIDEASDLMGDGKTEEAVKKYREALRLLEQVEDQNPERAATPEFQSVRNKRAYVDAQLNAILLEEARVNARAVAVTDTTALEKSLLEKREKAAEEKASADEKERTVVGTTPGGQPKTESQMAQFMDSARARDKKLSERASSAKFERESEEKIAELLAADPQSRKARLMRAGLELYRKNYGTARKEVDALLAKDPSDVSALNLRAAIETATGDCAAAEATLVRAIRAKESDYHAYYNLAKLLVKRAEGEDLARAQRLYKAGRKSKEDGGPGGPEDPHLEKAFE